MKKFIALMLVLVMALALVACGGKSGSAASFTTVEEGKLIMATNAAFPPYEFYEGDKIVGIDAEIAQAIADKLGLELVIDDMEFDSIIEAVKGGKADMGLAGMTVTDERKEVVNFTASYATGVQVIIVTEGSAITSVDDLFAEGAFTTIGVQRNTTGDLYTTWDLEDEGLGEIMRYSKGAEAVQALLTGKVDCVVIDNENVFKQMVSPPPDRHVRIHHRTGDDRLCTLSPTQHRPPAQHGDSDRTGQMRISGRQSFGNRN